MDLISNYSGPRYTRDTWYVLSCRDEFKLKLALLSNQWQGVVRRAQQRRGIIDSLLRQWQRYREMVEKLRKWLAEISQHSDALQPGSTISLQQARAMLDAVQVKRNHTSCDALLFQYVLGFVSS